jgi:hypothetical protein
MYTQILGKLKLALCPFLNQWWEVALSVSVRGITTGTIPWKGSSFDVELDFIDHRARIRLSDGRTAGLTLEPRSVAQFYELFMDTLRSLGIAPTISTLPSEVGNPIAFDRDTTHTAYDGAAVQRWWRILLATERVINRFRTPFHGKSSAVNFFWGGFDLNHTRFNGQAAPVSPTIDPINRYAENEANFSIGFWAGSARTPANFYAYITPAPEGVETATVQPEGAVWSTSLSEFILPYETARNAADPDEVILTFFQSAYEVCADMSGWDRAALEGDVPPAFQSP